MESGCCRLPNMVAKVMLLFQDLMGFTQFSEEVQVLLCILDYLHFLWQSLAHIRTHWLLKIGEILSLVSSWWVAEVFEVVSMSLVFKKCFFLATMCWTAGDTDRLRGGLNSWKRCACLWSQPASKGPWWSKGIGISAWDFRIVMSKRSQWSWVNFRSCVCVSACVLGMGRDFWIFEQLFRFKKHVSYETTNKILSIFK